LNRLIQTDTELQNIAKYPGTDKHTSQLKSKTTRLPKPSGKIGHTS